MVEKTENDHCVVPPDLTSDTVAKFQDWESLMVGKTENDRCVVTADLTSVIVVYMNCGQQKNDHSLVPCDLTSPTLAKS